MVTGIITAAGLGTRSGLDGKFRKELLPIYDRIDDRLVLRPVIDVVYRRLRKYGCNKIILVLDPADQMSKLYVESNFEDFEIVFQKEKKGFGNAVFIAAQAAGNSDFVLNAGDGVVANSSYYETICTSGCTNLNIFRVDHPEKYGNAVLDESSKTVREVVEKPQHPKSNFAIAALYFFKNDFVQFLDQSTVELTDSINNYIKAGNRVSYNIMDRNDWISIGRKDEYYKVLERSYKISATESGLC